MSITDDIGAAIARGRADIDALAAAITAELAPLERTPEPDDPVDD